MVANFQQSVVLLNYCAEHLEDDLSPEEEQAREELILLCHEIVNEVKEIREMQELLTEDMEQLGDVPE